MINKIKCFLGWHKPVKKLESTPYEIIYTKQCEHCEEVFDFFIKPKLNGYGLIDLTNADLCTINMDLSKPDQLRN